MPFVFPWPARCEKCNEDKKGCVPIPGHLYCSNCAKPKRKDRCITNSFHERCSHCVTADRDCLPCHICRNGMHCLKCHDDPRGCPKVVKEFQYREKRSYKKRKNEKENNTKSKKKKNEEEKELSDVIIIGLGEEEQEEEQDIQVVNITGLPICGTAVMATIEPAIPEKKDSDPKIIGVGATASGGWIMKVSTPGPSGSKIIPLKTLVESDGNQMTRADLVRFMTDKLSNLYSLFPELKPQEQASDRFSPFVDPIEAEFPLISSWPSTEDCDLDLPYFLGKDPFNGLLSPWDMEK